MSEASVRSGFNEDRWDLPPGLFAPRTRFVGREAELLQLEEILADPACRLLTITGTGGVGKTRLSLALAERPTFVNRVGFVPLADVQDPALIPATILRALGLEALPSQSVLDVVTASLRDRGVLLILDNLEHLAAADLIIGLLDSCPDLQIVATSRLTLGVSGEQRFPLAPLALSAAGADVSIADSPAVRLFVDRVRLVLPSFQITAANLADIAIICRQVDGLPLAIELAAAHCRQLAPHLLAERLHQRVVIPATGPRDSPLRHQTMQATVTWSVNLLDPGAADLWRALGIFEGGFTLESAEAVGAAIGVEPVSIAPLLDVLEVHDLVGLGTNPLGEPRYRMLQITREVALDALNDDPRQPVVAEAHARALEVFCARAESGLMGTDGTSWFARVEAEIANVRAAFTRDLAASNIARALAMASQLNWFWTDPGYLREGLQWLSLMLSRATDEVSSTTRAAAHAAASAVATWLDDHDTARHHATAALALWEEAGDQHGIMDAMLNLGNIAFDTGDPADAERWFRDGHDLAVKRQEPWAMPAFANLLALTAAAQGRFASAVEWHRAALAGWRASGYESYVSIAETGLAWSLLALEHDAEAVVLLRSALVRISQLAVSAESTTLVLDAAVLASRAGSPIVAVRFFAAASRQRHDLGSPHRPYIEADTQRRLDALRSSLGEATFGRAWSEGGSLSLATTCAEISTLLNTIDEHALLTARERDVLLLLVEGASDNEIADRLFISRRTASKHVAAILEKLGAPNRTTAVVMAYRRGLVMP